MSTNLFDVLNIDMLMEISKHLDDKSIDHISNLLNPPFRYSYPEAVEVLFENLLKQKYQQIYEDIIKPNLERYYARFKQSIDPILIFEELERASKKPFLLRNFTNGADNGSIMSFLKLDPPGIEMVITAIQNNMPIMLKLLASDKDIDMTYDHNKVLMVAIKKKSPEMIRSILSWRGPSGERVVPRDMDIKVARLIGSNQRTLLLLKNAQTKKTKSRRRY